MTDFAAIRRRAESQQEEAPLGTPMYQLTQDVLHLLEVLKASDNSWRFSNGALAARIAELEKERVSYSVACTSRDIDPETYAGMIDCGTCGDVHGEHSQCDPDAVANNDKFVGTVPHE